MENSVQGMGAKTENLLTHILIIRAGLRVKRYHTVHCNVCETVGMHSSGVAAIALAITDGQCSQGLLASILYHDAMEQYTGDVPATAKWAYEELDSVLKKIEKDIAPQCPWHWPELTEEEQVLLKVCDMLDLCFKSVEEIETGNIHFNVLLERGVMYLRGLYLPHEYSWATKANYILTMLEKKQEKLNGGKR